MWTISLPSEDVGHERLIIIMSGFVTMQQSLLHSYSVVDPVRFSLVQNLVGIFDHQTAVGLPSPSRAPQERSCDECGVTVG